MAEISVTETNQRRTQARILDVREDVEVASGMIPGALHMPMSEIPNRVDELESSTPLIVVCRSGNRSAHVADALTAAGFTADTMTGGMIAWARAGLPTT
ncbi:rhodanese-like domain-containing protein [Arthrobacter sp. B1805]|uniref:rhodanese-like domain-containing protein n=1 Tax=Arthrobacter sp. B1805 TaxID=2058892 RepID=UPI000CE4AEF3|nr:rhodanese-like domain-containing protein [Arthrobacter sp. B1805]